MSDGHGGRLRVAAFGPLDREALGREHAAESVADRTPFARAAGHGDQTHGGINQPLAVDGLANAVDDGGGEFHGVARDWPDRMSGLRNAGTNFDLPEKTGIDYPLLMFCGRGIP